MRYITNFKPLVWTLFLLLLTTVSCVTFPEIPLPPNQIVFLCDDCNCFLVNTRYIAQKKLDKKYKIIVDTSCLYQQELFTEKIHITYLTKEEIRKEFGEFDTFLLIDSTGKRIEPHIGADLEQYIR